MTIEAMKQALEVLEDFVDDPRCQKQIDDASIALRQAIDAYTLSSKPPGLCMCGEPWRLESVHRKKSPCFDYIEREWVGLTDDEIDLLEELYAPPVHPDFVNDASHCLELIRHVEAKLKEKNT